jgi:hypothetical protein
MNLRLGLTYAPGDHGPPSVVVKLPSPDPVSRQSGVMLRNYEREVCFYREVAATVAIRAPHCFHAEWHPEDGEFAIVLEDVAPAVQGDQVIGCSTDIARDAVVELARLHGPRWGDPRLGDIEWLSRRESDDDVARLELIYAMTWPGFLETYGEQLDTEAIALGARFGGLIRPWLDARQEPFTITHGDYRLDNLLFRPPGGTGAPVIAVDWQTPGHGPAVADLAYFLGAGLLPAERVVHERALIDAYLAELATFGVELDAAECWRQYRREAFAGVVMSVVASQIVGRTERSVSMFTAMATRHFRHALDLDAAAALV